MPGWSIEVGPLARAFRSWNGERGGALLVAPQVPQLSPRLLADAAELLSEFDAVLGPTTGDGWWTFGLREPSHGAVLRTMSEALSSAGALTVAALRLGLRVAILPTLQELCSGADVPAVAGHCPAGSEFAVTVAHLTRVRP